jgi:signal transduction histidine kinase
VGSPKAPPHLAEATDLVGAGLRAGTRRLARLLKPHCEALDARFARLLGARGLDARQIRALTAVTLGAGARLLAGRRPLADFFEQVEYNGRRLAKLGVPPAVLLAALADYDRLVARRLRKLPPSGLAEARRVSGQLTFSIVLTLSNAFYDVREGETAAFFALHEAWLSAATPAELLAQYLAVLARFCRSDAAAGLLCGRGGEIIATAGAAPLPAGASPAFLRRPSLLRAGTARGLLDPSWRGRFASVWSVPLTGDSIRGAMQFAFVKHYQWLPRERRLLEGAAARCVTVAEKLRLAEELAAREVRIRKLAAHLVEVEERERRRISRELHDETGQVLPYLRLHLEMLGRSQSQAPAALRRGLAEACELLGRAVVEIRRILADLSPVTLEQLGLAAALRQLLRRFRQHYRLSVRSDLGHLGPVPKDMAIIVYRLVQECCNNAARHSSASHLIVSLRSDDKQLRMRVEDDGVGFRVEEALAKPDLFGLTGMRERVALAGGVLSIHSRPGRGTRISVVLPLAAARAQRLRGAPPSRNYAEDQDPAG